MPGVNSVVDIFKVPTSCFDSNEVLIASCLVYRENEMPFRQTYHDRMYNHTLPNIDIYNSMNHRLITTSMNYLCSIGTCIMTSVPEYGNDVV